MDGSLTISITFLISLISAGIALYGFNRNKRSDIESDDKKMSEIREGIIKLNLKSDNLCQNMNEMRVDTKSQLKELSERQQATEKSIAVIQNDLAAAFKRLENLENENDN